VAPLRPSGEDAEVETADELSWTHDGVWHRSDAGTHRIQVLDHVGEPFALAVDVEVKTGAGRWSATVFTPEQIRECLDRWARTGEQTSARYFWCPDGIVVPEGTLANIAAVVAAHVDADGSMSEPFRYLGEDEDCELPDHR
jgi:hypothetical protein